MLKGFKQKQVSKTQDILSVDGVRQKLRIHVYPELMKVLNG